MQSGVLTNESFSELLRSVSQKRRQGVLEILSRHGRVEVSFVQGRIVESKQSDLTPIQETVAWLNRGGYKLRNPEEYPEQTYQALFETIKKDIPEFTPHVLKAVISERILETVYHFDLNERAMFSFHVQMVEIEKDFSPALSVGQVLLDFVEIHEVTESFEMMTRDATVLSAVGKIPVDLTSSEKNIVGIVQNFPDIQQAKSRSMMSEFQFMRAVVDLINQGVLVCRAEAEDTQSKTVDVADFVSSSIDKAFADDERAGGDLNPKQTPVSARFFLWNTVLLKSELVPKAVALVIFFAGLLMPFFVWGRLIRYFAG